MFILPDYEERPKDKSKEPTTSAINQPDEEIGGLSKNELEFVSKCFLWLKKMGIVSHKGIFCQEFLGRSKDYLSMLENTQSTPSVSCLYSLSQSLRLKSDEYELTKPAIYRNLNKLYEQCELFLFQRYRQIPSRKYQKWN